MEAAFNQFLKKIDDLQQLGPDGQAGFAREFQLLRKGSLKYKSDKNYSTEAGERSVNKVKNRFKDILPFDSTRVKLPCTGADGSDYINANFIKGPNDEKVYIASQGPLPHTVNDFWRMLWHYRVKVVVMLCREDENGKRKCQRYWCENDEEKLNFDGITVKTKKSVGVDNDFIMRTLLAEFQGEELMLTQFHYTAWPDHGVPPTAMPLIELVKLVREYQPDDNPPIVVHCSAGCGRTGTICGLDYTQTLLKHKRVNELDPFKIVENLRKQRPAMVQTKGQYEFLCRAMVALYREKLKIPIEEEMESHLYENVTMGFSNDDSDSDSSLSPSSPAPGDPVTGKPFHQRDKSPTFTPAKERHSKPRSPAPHGNLTVTDKKRVGQLSQQVPTDNYVNVSFDLIDLSNDDPATNSRKSHVNYKIPGSGKNYLDSVSLQSNKGEKSQTKSNSVERSNPTAAPKKVPLSKQRSSDEYVVTSRSKSPRDARDEPGYVMPPRGGQSSIPWKTQSMKKSKPTANTSSKQRYENIIPASQVRSTAATPPVVASKNPTPVSSGVQMYENVEVPKSGNAGRKSPIVAKNLGSQERSGKNDYPDITPKPSREYLRSHSSSENHHPAGARDEQKFGSCGPKIGAKYANQVKAMNGVQRAKVLPNEDTGRSQMSDSQVEKDFFKENDVGSGLYASVGNRNKTNFRKQANATALTPGDSVDSGHRPDVLKKREELFTADDQDSNSESKSKTSKLQHKKFPFLQSKKHDVQGSAVEHIGYGVRLPKPKGPRSPPKSWALRT